MLEYDKQNKQRCAHKKGRGAYIAPLRSGLKGHRKHRKSEGQRTFADRIRHNERPEEIVPLVGDRNHAKGNKRRF